MNKRGIVVFTIGLILIGISLSLATSVIPSTIDGPDDLSWLPCLKACLMKSLMKFKLCLVIPFMFHLGYFPKMFHFCGEFKYWITNPVMNYP